MTAAVREECINDYISTRQWVKERTGGCLRGWWRQVGAVLITVARISFDCCRCFVP